MKLFERGKFLSMDGAAHSQSLNSLCKHIIPSCACVERGFIYTEMYGFFWSSQSCFFQYRKRETYCYLVQGNQNLITPKHNHKHVVLSHQPQTDWQKTFHLIFYPNENREENTSL